MVKTLCEAGEVSRVCEWLQTLNPYICFAQHKLAKACKEAEGDLRAKGLTDDAEKLRGRTAAVLQT